MAQLYYLAPIDFYFSLLNQPSVEFGLNEKYDRRTMRNRANLVGPNGQILLVIPTEKLIPNERYYKNIKIAYAEPWQKKHWKSIESAYRRSPFFEYYESHFQKFYSGNKFEYLWELNFALMNVTCQLMKMPIELKLSSLEGEIEIGIQNLNFPIYKQVFDEKVNFIPNLSILDLLFNKGPDAINYLRSIKLL